MKFEEDPRTACKYGENCYQKNSKHMKRFKHPNKERESKDTLANEDNSSVKKQKIEGTENFREETSTSNVLVKDDPSDKEESDFLSSSPEDVKENIKQKFLVDMPDDFYDMWSFCTELNDKSPEEALKDVGLRLVGPFDVLSGKIKNVAKDNRKLCNYLTHWRYYYDPPEFQTVLCGKNDEFHIGYFRDNPSDFPSLVASMCLSKKGILTCMGDNVFAAIHLHIQSCLKSSDTFKIVVLQKLLNKVDDYAKRKSYLLEVQTKKIKERKLKVVAKGFNGIGIVVPVDKKNEVGYREIPETDANLRRMLKRIVDAKDEATKDKCFDDLQEILTNVQFANDEGDFGMGLELGLDLLAFGGDEFNATVLHLLSVAYDLLDRKPFAQIIKAHMTDRKVGSTLSLVE